MTSRTAMFSPRGALIALGVAIGALHLLIANGRATPWIVEGVTLAVIGIVSIVAALALSRTARRWPVITLMSVCSAIIVGLLLTRAHGYPLGPLSGLRAPMGSYDILVLVLAASTLSLSAASLIIGHSWFGPSGWRFDTVAPVAVVLAALPGLAVSSWTDTASHVSGATHVHGVALDGSLSPSALTFRAALTAEERQRLGDELVRARTAALTYPTLADALFAGWTPIGNSVRGSGQMVIDITNRPAIASFDAERPVALLYASADDTAPIVAVQYEAWTSSTTPPTGFTGQDALWHLHTGTCIVGDDVHIVYDEPHVGTRCAGIDGTYTKTLSWMIRAWVVPGWENPSGTFAHDHPNVG